MILCLVMLSHVVQSDIPLMTVAAVRMLAKMEECFVVMTAVHFVMSTAKPMGYHLVTHFVTLLAET